jgi:hypothetical protein
MADPPSLQAGVLQWSHERDATTARVPLGLQKCHSECLSLSVTIRESADALSSVCRLQFNENRPGRAPKTAIGALYLSATYSRMTISGRCWGRQRFRPNAPSSRWGVRALALRWPRSHRREPIAGSPIALGITRAPS